MYRNKPELSTLYTWDSRKYLVYNTIGITLYKTTILASVELLVLNLWHINVEYTYPLTIDMVDPVLIFIYKCIENSATTHHLPHVY